MNSCTFSKGGLLAFQGKVHKELGLPIKKLTKLKPDKLCKLYDTCRNTNIVPPMQLAIAKNGTSYLIDQRFSDILKIDDYLKFLEPQKDDDKLKLSDDISKILKNKLNYKNLSGDETYKHLCNIIIDILVDQGVREPIQLTQRVTRKKTIQRFNESEVTGTPSELVEGDENINNTEPVNANNVKLNFNENNNTKPVNANNVKLNFNENNNTKPVNVNNVKLNFNENQTRNQNSNRNQNQSVNTTKTQQTIQAIKNANQQRRKLMEEKLRAAAGPQATAAPAAATQVVTTGVAPAAGGNVARAPAASGNTSKAPAAGGNASKAPAAGGNASKAPAAGGNASKAPAAGGNSNKFNRKAEIDNTYGMIAAGDMSKLLMAHFEKNPTDQQLFIDIYNFFRGVLVDIGLKRKQKASVNTKSPALQAVVKIQQVYGGTGTNTVKLDQRIFMFPEYVSQLKEVLETFSKDKHVKLRTIINNINQSAANVKKALRNAYSTKVSWSNYFRSFALKPNLSKGVLYLGVTPEELAKLIMNTGDPKGFINSLNYNSFNKYLTEVQQEAFQKLAEDKKNITQQRLKDLMTSNATRMSDDQRIKMRIRLEQIQREKNNEKQKTNSLHKKITTTLNEVRNNLVGQ